MDTFEVVWADRLQHSLNTTWASMPKHMQTPGVEVVRNGTTSLFYVIDDSNIVCGVLFASMRDKTNTLRISVHVEDSAGTTHEFVNFPSAAEHIARLCYPQAFEKKDT